ncbi:FAD/NAD(P)-binding protein [Streptomyces shaanxiensis]|uniref:FAD-dependent urate hydroxylase HpyO/Asp monooxygenase CreE-like FAD/NAD(P)-binding domain-containing protein n=1 Tax=Streptomyces shaanxiensis TaxID=653357 RepID=A0ABP7UH98_9ACTN
MSGPGEALAVRVIGAGPRGLSVLERICANAAGAARPVTVHLVDPYSPAHEDLGITPAHEDLRVTGHREGTR